MNFPRKITPRKIFNPLPPPRVIFREIHLVPGPLINIYMNNALCIQSNISKKYQTPELPHSMHKLNSFQMLKDMKLKTVYTV